jgi:hypothetical protein
MLPAVFLIVGFLSLSPGLSVSPGATECAEVLRQLTNGNKPGKITHVHTASSASLDPRLISSARIIEPIVRAAVAYTIQGPGSEVGIVVCGSARPAPDPDPDPQTVQ